MRRLIAIFFLTVYFNVAWGAAFNLHFCCGHLSDISFASLSHRNSDNCKIKNAMQDCCKDKTLQVTTDNHKTFAGAVFAENTYKDILFTYSGPEENKVYYHRHSDKSFRLHYYRSCFPSNIFIVYRNLRI